MSKKFYVIVALVLMVFGTFQFWIWSGSKLLEIRNEITFLESQIKVFKFLIKRNKEAARKRPKAGGETRKEIDLGNWIERTGKHKIIEAVKRKFGGRIRQIARKHSVDPRLILAVIVVESAGRPRAVSASDARGLMQLKPKTARALGVKDLFHPYENIWGGTKYLKKLQKRFGNLDTALAAYNLGPTKVARLLKKGFDPSAYVYVQKVKFLKTL